MSVLQHCDVHCMTFNAADTPYVSGAHRRGSSYAPSSKDGVVKNLQPYSARGAAAHSGVRISLVCLSTLDLHKRARPREPRRSAEPLRPRPSGGAGRVARDVLGVRVPLGRAIKTDGAA